MRHYYGYVPDLKDSRDRDFLTWWPFPVKKHLPPKVDLRPGMSPVEDQGELGSCTANALAGAVQYLYKKSGLPYQDFSRLFIYYNERATESTINTDSGAMIRDGIKSLARQGACFEKSWPYDISKFKDEPPQTCYDEAQNHQITSYNRIKTLDQMKSCLADGFPFVNGFPVYESLETEEVAKTGVVPDPDPDNEQCLGGHAVCTCGFDDDIQRFIVKNSWSDQWGDMGYFYVSYNYWKKLASDLWVIRRECC